MYVIIAGGGMVGGELARKLVENKHDVVVIERDQERCDRLHAETGAVVIPGNAAQAETLREAGVEKADVVVAATGDDAANLACAILAKSFGVPDVIVRMRNPEYENAYKLIGVSSIIRVTDLMVSRMMMEIERPKVRRIITIGGRADIYSVVIPKGAKVAGKRVEEIAAHPNFPPQCVFIAVYNREKDELTIPRGKQVINEGDELFLISSPQDIKRAVDLLTG
ncbi:TrkA family potassium uptake protein [Candidatus Poribacteria bacterium]|nr:MAG: TrkA family potassium uptake protein [Candidatus Poribacteria bacterium]